MKNAPDFRALVHSPSDLSAEHLAWAESIQTGQGIRWGIPAIDRVVIPMQPGNLTCLIARPGSGKTSLMAYLARHEAAVITARGATDEAVVYVTWEQSAEELEAFFQTDGTYSISDIAWGRVDLEIMRQRAVKRAKLPIWVIGHGIGRADRRLPRMTPEAVLHAVETMHEDYGVKPSLLLFDYMQIIPVGRADDRVKQVTEVPILIKELNLRIGAPAVVGVQASREVDTRTIKIPELADAQWASSIEQTADKVFGLWRPAVTEEGGTLIELGRQQYPVNDQLFVLRLLKQRGDRARFTWVLHFHPAYLQLAELEIEHAAEWERDK